MARKRRQAHNTSAQRTSAAANRETAADLKITEQSLYNLRSYYDRLSADVVEIFASLERTLLLHSLVALVVQNALLAQEVSTAQIALLVTAAFWMMRKSIVTMLLAHTALRIKGIQKVFWRSTILVLVLSEFGVACHHFELSLNTSQLVNFFAVYLLEMLSIHYLRKTKGRLSCLQIILSATENTVLVACFRNSFDHTKEMVVDEIAVALTVSTTFVHVIVLLTAKYVVLHYFDSDTNGAFAKAQQRGAKLLEKTWQDVGHFEPDPFLVASAGVLKKKKAKSTPRASLSKSNAAGNDVSLDTTLLTQQSVFNDSRVQLAILTLVQMLLLLSQVWFSAFILYSWDTMSALMVSSSHVLWTLGQVRQKVSSCRTIGSSDQELKIAQTC